MCTGGSWPRSTAVHCCRGRGAATANRSGPRGPQQPHNLGALFRSAPGWGMDAVLLSPNVCRPALPPECAGQHGRGLRGTVCPTRALPKAWGSCVRPILLAGPQPWLRAVEIQTLPAELRRRPALLLGAEGTGLSPPPRRLADANVIIRCPARRLAQTWPRPPPSLFWELSRH